MSVATAEAAPPVGEDVGTLFYKLGDAFSETHARIDARFDRLEARFDRLEARMDARFDELVGLIRRNELKL